MSSHAAQAIKYQIFHTVSFFNSLHKYGGSSKTSNTQIAYFSRTRSFFLRFLLFELGELDGRQILQVFEALRLSWNTQSPVGFPGGWASPGGIQADWPWSWGTGENTLIFVQFALELHVFDFQLPDPGISFGQEHLELLSRPHFAMICKETFVKFLSGNKTFYERCTALNVVDISRAKETTYFERQFFSLALFMCFDNFESFEKNEKVQLIIYL